MKLITARDLIRTVSERWRAAYRLCQDATPFGTPQAKTQARLAALDLETATPAEVNAIIGNSSWTQEACNECNRSDADALILFGQEPDYDSCGAYVCVDCLRKAMTLVGAPGGEIKVG